MAAELETRLERLQERSELNFKSYKTSAVHQERLSRLPLELRIPRDEWFTHKMYRRQFQMPNFHVHFREEMGSVLKWIDKARAAASSAADINNGTEAAAAMNACLKAVRTGYNVFKHSMETLGFHVRIEEHRVFPMYEKACRSLAASTDLRFLYEDHKHLHEVEASLTDAFTKTMAILEASTLPAADARQMAINTLIERALVFDTTLLNHLGEEEEVVVPISLNFIMEH